MRVFTSAGTTSICILLLAATLFGAGQVAAQQPSPDQKSRMRETRKYGSVGGAGSNPRSDPAALK